MKHRNDIDGLRALAVVPIVLFHSGISEVSGGFVGVDIFFVISGFLIAGLIRRDLADGKFSIWRFYDRRIRRIIPALLATLLLTMVAGLFLLLPSFYVDLARSVVAATSFLSNLYFWKYSGYFDNSAQMRPLLHTWSLAVEEQYYIFMPLVLLFLARFRNETGKLILLALAAASLLLSIYAMKVAPTANFFLLPTRAWELLLGALLAYGAFPKIERPWMLEVSAIAGITAIAAPLILYTEATPFPGLGALLPCLGAALLIQIGRQTYVPLVCRPLHAQPAVFIGTISYSLYLIHWPVTVYFKYWTLAPLTAANVAAIIGISVLLAYGSCRWIEQPFRHGALPFSHQRVIAIGAAGMLMVSLAAGSGVWANGFKGRFSDYEAPKAEVKKTWNNGACFFENDPGFRQWKAEKCRIGAGTGDAVLLWGDSYAAHYVPGLSKVSTRSGGRIYQYTYAGCPPVLSYFSYARPLCAEFNRKALQIIKEQNIRHVILSARWVDMKTRGFSEIGSTLSALQSAGVSVTLIGQSPMFITDLPVIAYRFIKTNEGEASWYTSINPEINAELKSSAPGVNFINPMLDACGNGRCNVKSAGQLIYFDSGHLSDFGSGWAVARYLADQI